MYKIEKKTVIKAKQAADSGYFFYIEICIYTKTIFMMYALKTLLRHHVKISLYLLDYRHKFVYRVFKKKKSQCTIYQNESLTLTFEPLKCARCIFLKILGRRGGESTILLRYKNKWV